MYNHINNEEVINIVMDDLIPLFGLSAKKEEVDKLPTRKETKDWESKLKIELSRLQKIHESGDFLAKDEDKIKKKIENITRYLQRWNKMIGGIYHDYKKIENKNKEIYKEDLFLDFKKKLKEFEHSPYTRDKLVKKRDTLKKNLKELLEKIRFLGKVDN